MSSTLPQLIQDTHKIRQITDRFRREFTLYGYETVETPIIEPADLFLTRAGDQVIKKLFTFERYGRQLALRPEFTATAAHRYTQLLPSGVVRWQFSGPVFEDTADNAAPDYQKLSIGAELIGASGPAADAEILSLAVRGIIRQGISDWQLVVGHTGLLRHLLARYELDNRTERFLLNHAGALRDPARGKAYILEAFDRALLGGAYALDHLPEQDSDLLGLTETETHQMLGVLLDATQRGMTMGGRNRHDIARRLLRKRQRFSQRQQVVQALDFLEKWAFIQATPHEAFALLDAMIAEDDATAQRYLAEWQQTITLLSAYDINPQAVLIQPHVMRDWDYYTGMVFQLRAEDGTQIGGGGRYDELISLVGGQTPVPAVGFAYYLDQLLLHITPPTEGDFVPVAVVFQPDNAHEATRLAHQLRDQQFPVILLPQEIADSHSHDRVIQIESDAAKLNGVRYPLHPLDTLISELKRVYYE